MPIPASVLKLVAPVLINRFANTVLGGASSPESIVNAATGNITGSPQPTDDALTAAKLAAPLDVPAPVLGMVREYFDHQKDKASVRPAITRRMGNATLLNAAVTVGLAVCHAFGAIEAEALFNAAMVLAGVATGTGGTYLYGHTTRSIEKAKGAD